MPYLSLDTFLELVLPKLVGMTLLGFVAASAVGGLVGWIGTLIWRRLQHQRGLENAQSAHSLVSPAIHGAFICLLLGMLTYEANPASLFGGPYSGLARYISYLLILPSSSFTGAIIGAVAGAKLPTTLKQPGLGSCFDHDHDSPNQRTFSNYCQDFGLQRNTQIYGVEC